MTGLGCTLHRYARLVARWLALGILFIGIVLVQSPKVAEEASGSHFAVLGMAAVVSACVLSGLAGVWLERIVKRTDEAPPPREDAPPAALSRTSRAATTTRHAAPS